MSIFPVAIGLMASFFSAVSILGVSSEIYVHGTQFVAINLAYGFGTWFAAHLYLPVFFNLKAASSFEVWHSFNLKPNFHIPIVILFSSHSIIIFTVLRKTFWSSNQIASKFRLVGAASALHKYRPLRASFGFGSDHWHTPDNQRRGHRLGLHFLLHNWGNQSCPHHRRLSECTYVRFGYRCYYNCCYSSWRLR